VTGSSGMNIPRPSALLTQSKRVLNGISDWFTAISIFSVMHYLLLHHLPLCSLEFLTVSFKEP
jgi:hypothetical protein